jgi:hypothetical protein
VPASSSNKILSLKEQIDLHIADIYIVLHPKEIINSFFSASQGKFFKNHFLGQKVYRNKNIEIISCILICQME